MAPVLQKNEAQEYRSPHRWQGVVLGFLFGLLFPLLGTAVEADRLQVSTPLGIWNLQRSTPLLWIIDCAPIVLSILGGLFTQPQRSTVLLQKTQRPLWTLLCLMAVVPILLLLFSFLEEARVEQANEAAQRSSSLRYKSLIVYHLAQPASSPTAWQDIASEIDSSRTALARAYPQEAPLLNSAWTAFNGELSRTGHVGWPTALRMLQAADRATTTILQDAEARDTRSDTIRLVGVLGLLLLLPMSLGVLNRLHQTEGSLREEQEFTDAVLTATGALIVVLRTDGSIVRMNQAAKTLTGDSAGELEGQSFARIFPHSQDSEAALSDGVLPAEYEADYLTRSGERKRILWSTASTLDKTGAVRYVVATGLNITERQKTEQCLQESERRLQDAQRTALIGSWEHDLETGEVTWTDETFRLLQFDSRSGVPEYPMLLSRFHPEDRDQVIDRVEKAKASGQSYEIDIRIVLNDGTTRWLHSQGRGERTAGNTQISRLVGTMQDITERKLAEQRLQESERQLREAQENARIGSWEFDFASGKIFWSEETFHLLELDPAAGEPDYQTHMALYHPEDAPRLQEAVQSAMQDGTPYRFDLRRAPDAEGIIRWVHATGRAIRDSEGHVVRLQGTVQDITERKRAEEQLQSLTAELQRSNEALQEFARVASHDLKEPLRKVRSFGSMLKRRAGNSLSPEAADYLDRMTGATDRMQALIDGLLAYSRVSSKPATPEILDLNTVVAGVLSDLETRVAETHAVVEVGPLPVVRADALQMRQLFQNLIGNALKYQNEGAIPHVRVHADGNPEEQILLQVEDNGIGFAPEHAERVFGVFERLVGRDQPQYEGAGVGLAICKKIVERHGGTITAEGHPGEGAIFTVRLPGS